MNINKKYKYFAYIPKIKKIVFGWEIISDVESLKYYAHIDMADNEYKKSQYKLLSAKGLMNIGINPYDSNNWATNSEELEYIKSNQQLNGNMAKFKKGSLEAKKFMAGLRSKKKSVKKSKAPKKRKKLVSESNALKNTLKRKKMILPHGYELQQRKRLSGMERHTDNKSHNYRINISGSVSRSGEIKSMKKFAKQRRSKLHEKVANIIAANTDKNSLPESYMQDVVQYGCQSGIVPQLIYYTDTKRFLKAYNGEIARILADLMDDMGVRSPADMFGSKWDESDPFASEDHNKNLLAWFGFEEATRHLAADLGYDI